MFQLPEPVDAGKTDSEVGDVGPPADSHRPQKENVEMHEQIAGAECHREVNLSEPHDDKEEMLMFHNSHDLNFAPFFCAYIRRSALDESAGLDAQYGRHYRSDRIMCDFVRHVLGRKIVYVAAAVVYHSLQSSTEELRCDESRQKEFDEICNKNRWPEELGAALGYGVPIWDRS